MTGYGRALLLTSHAYCENLDEAGDLLSLALPHARQAIDHVRAAGDTDLLSRLRGVCSDLTVVADDIYAAANHEEDIA
jgi:hypothetical protein